MPPTTHQDADTERGLCQIAGPGISLARITRNGEMREHPKGVAEFKEGPSVSHKKPDVRVLPKNPACPPLQFKVAASSIHAGAQFLGKIEQGQAEEVFRRKKARRPLLLRGTTNAVSP